MKHIIYTACIIAMLFSCNTKSDTGTTGNTNKTTDTLSYAYKATYSSDVTVPSHPEYAQRVLSIWKMFESNNIEGMKQYYADTVTYEAGSSRFHGSKADLLDYARKDIEGLDSLRFDISTWQSIHFNNKNEDWVYVWAAERRYGKDHTADTSLIHEQWKIENGKVSYFNLYSKKVPRV